ncbi:hypothetical protein [Ectobacillus funiculus]|uniref:Phage protein n=1 Tax=Ectobacillus funiculus TaxID=137993 RepID=A0ABV5WMC5_9BACI
MRRYRNVNTGAILTEQELHELHLREYEEMWGKIKDNLEHHALQNKKEDFITYMFENDLDFDFEEIEEA